MKIIVTGGCGYKGSILVPKLLERGYDVTVLDVLWFGNHLADHPCLTIIENDIRDISEIEFQSTDIIIHLAAVANDPCSELNPKFTWEINALSTMNLIEKAIRNNVPRFIYASSGSVYGIKDEKQVTEDLELVPVSDYNKTKMTAERIILSYKDEISIQIARPATVCGYSPRMRLDLSVNMLTMQALINNKITVFGGSQTRPNIHIQDVTNAYLHLIDHENLTGIYNIGFENLKISEIARLITDKVPADIITTESNDPRSYRINSDKLLSTNFLPKYNVNDAIDEIINRFNSGDIKDIDECYNLKHMKNIFT